MMRILVLEDEMLIALDLEITLRELGVDEVHLASSVDHALSLLGSADFTGAIVDYNLGIETSAPVLADLECRNVPFVVMSGYPDSRFLGDGSRTWPMLSKPADQNALRDALNTMGLPRS